MQEAKEYLSFPLGNRLYIRLGLYSRAKTFHAPRKITQPVCFVKQKKLFFDYDLSSIRHKQSISWTFLNNAMAISAKEMPKNHTVKERFAAASSCIQRGILRTFARKFPNIDFFLKILPLNDDELLMSEM